MYRQRDCEKTSFLSSSCGIWAQVTETRQWIYHKWAMQLSWEWPRDRNQYGTKHSATDSRSWQSVLVSFYRKKWIIGLCEPPTFLIYCWATATLEKSHCFTKVGSNEWAAEDTLLERECLLFISSTATAHSFTPGEEGKERDLHRRHMVLCMCLTFLIFSSRGPQWTGHGPEKDLISRTSPQWDKIKSCSIWSRKIKSALPALLWCIH